MQFLLLVFVLCGAARPQPVSETEHTYEAVEEEPETNGSCSPELSLVSSPPPAGCCLMAGRQGGARRPQAEWFPPDWPISIKELNFN